MLNFYDYPLYRPPAEANNIIIQATYGCSYNNCSFCSMYVDKKFKVRELDDIYKEIDILASNYPNATKVFLADGDALALDTSYMLKLLKYLSNSFVKLRRVSLYASTQNILNKTQDELELLYQNNLKLIYFGVESGNDLVLKKITKGVIQKQMIDSLNKVSKSNIKISATVILGIGGSVYSTEHIKDTAKLVNSTTINYLSTLQLGLDDDIKDRFYKNFDDFKLMDDSDIMIEQKSFIELLNPTNKVIFRSNHASNAFHLSGTLPKDKEKLLGDINYALGVGEDAFVPKDYRGF
ncbi:MAG: radical SAM protein [Campylobacterota bacterium]|nr:radical SAM protein [Campylobacterota bacterium]